MTIKDSDNLRRLEKLRPRYEKLRDLRIRNAADAERAERDLAEASKAAIEVAGTDDIEGLRRLITENYAANTAAVDEFEAVLSDIDAALAQADAD